MQSPQSSSQPALRSTTKSAPFHDISQRSNDGTCSAPRPTAASSHSPWPPRTLHDARPAAQSSQVAAPAAQSSQVAAPPVPVHAPSPTPPPSAAVLAQCKSSCWATAATDLASAVPPPVNTCTRPPGSPHVAPRTLLWYRDIVPPAACQPLFCTSTHRA